METRHTTCLASCNHPQLGFSGVEKCGDEYQFNSFSSFADELLHPVAARPNQNKLAAVLILSPDKTMLLLIGSSNESALSLKATPILAEVGLLLLQWSWEAKGNGLLYILISWPGGTGVATQPLLLLLLLLSCKVLYLLYLY